MSETRWSELAGNELRYGDHTWKLTGLVDARQTGEILHVEARQVDGVKHRTAILRFGLNDPPASLNPGDLGDHFDRLERDGGRWYLIVRKEARVYRYELDGYQWE